MRGMTIWNFKEGIFARVFNEGYVGLVDKELNYVVEPNKYKQIIDGGGSFLGGLLHVTYSGKHGCFNHKGELTIPFDYDSLVTRSNKIAFLKKEGKWSWYDNERGRFCESLFDTRPKGVGDDYVLAVKEGQQYLYRRDSCQKKAFSRPVQNCIQINSQSSNYYYPSINGFKGCILGNGELIIPIKYESVRYAQFANVFIVKDNYFSVLDTTGEFISKDVASSPFQLGGDRAFNNVLIIDKDGKKGLLDSYGRIVLAPVFDKVQSRPFKDSLYIVFHEGKGKIYNAETKNFLPNSYDELIWFRECLIVKNKGMYNFLDYDLKKVSHNSYTEIKREREFYIVKSKDKLGAVYRNGSEVVPCQYEEVIVQRHSVYLSAYSNNRSERDIYNSLGMKLIGNAQSTPDLHCNDSLLIFKVDGKEGLMKINGEVIVEPLYDYIFVNCEHALSAVKLEDKFGYINNRSGELVIPLRFGDARKFKGKMALVSDEKYGKLYWIDEKGNRVK